MPLYVAEGKSITSKRGVLTCDDDRPEITASDLYGVVGDAESMKRAAKAAERLLSKGYLVEADESPWHVAEDARLTKIEELESRGDAARAKTRAQARMSAEDRRLAVEQEAAEKAEAVALAAAEAAEAAVKEAAAAVEAAKVAEAETAAKAEAAEIAAAEAAAKKPAEVAPTDDPLAAATEAAKSGKRGGGAKRGG